MSSPHIAFNSNVESIAGAVAEHILTFCTISYLAQQPSPAGGTQNKKSW